LPGIVIRWLVTTLTILMIPNLISGIKVAGLGSALAAAAIIGVLNAVVRPVLIILTLPLTIVTLGVFILVINALLFELAGWMVSGIQIDSFWSAFLGSLIVSLVSWIMNSSIAGGPHERTIIVRRWGDTSTIDMHRGRRGRWE
jgi:putative membrane protein